jgi:flagellar basal-body rod modification protein FlgD
LISSGQVVWSGDAPDLEEGVHDFTWDGKTTGGGQVSDGVYTLKVTAKDSAASTVESQVLVRGMVTGVEMYDGQPYLTIAHSILPLSSVISLAQQASTDTQPPPAEDDQSQAA